MTIKYNLLLLHQQQKQEQELKQKQKPCQQPSTQQAKQQHHRLHHHHHLHHQPQSSLLSTSFHGRFQQLLLLILIFIFSFVFVCIFTITVVLFVTGGGDVVPLQLNNNNNNNNNNNHHLVQQYKRTNTGAFSNDNNNNDDVDYYEDYQQQQSQQQQQPQLTWSQVVQRLVKLQRNSTKFHSRHQQENYFHRKFSTIYHNRLLDLRNFSYQYEAKQSQKQCHDMMRNKLGTESIQKLNNNNNNDGDNDDEHRSLNLVIVIHSAAHHFVHRNFIRKTWFHVAKLIENDPKTVPAMDHIKVAYAFVLGLVAPSVNATTNNNHKMIQNNISIESQLYGDLVQGTFIDSYHNLTYKHLSTLRWTTEFCTGADFLLKLDDDAFIDLRAIVNYLASVKRKLLINDDKKKKKTKNAVNSDGGESGKNYRAIDSYLACTLFPPDTIPQRSRNSKWNLSLLDYPYSTFPSYCSGLGYFLSIPLAFDLYEAAHNAPPMVPRIGIDDVFITGLIRSVLQPPLHAVSINHRMVYNVDTLRKWLIKQQNNDKDNGYTPKCPSGYLIGDIGQEVDRTQIALQLWHATEQSWIRHDWNCTHQSQQQQYHYDGSNVRRGVYHQITKKLSIY